LLQRDALKFKQTDTYDGCDGKFGPITFDALIKKFPVLNPKPRQQVLERSRKERRKLAKKSGLPTPSSAPKQKKDVEREPINHKEVSYYGDSLTQQYTKYILSHREFQNHKNKDYKIGRAALTMRKRMTRNLDYYAKKKAIVIGAGTNDLGWRSANAIFRDIETMYTMLLKKNPRIQIIALTLLPYPGDKNKNKKIELINKKIRTFANRFPKNIRVIDLHKDFASMIKKYGRSKMLYSDKVHMKPKAARAVAQMVQDSVATGTYRNIEEYLS